MKEAQIIVFSLNDTHFGVSTEEVNEIIEYSLLTDKDKNENENERGRSSYCIEGFTYVRGNKIPVVNICKILELDETTNEGAGEKSCSNNSKILLSKIDNSDDSIMGFAVGNVIKILKLSDKSIHNTPEIVTTSKNACIKQIAIDEEQLIPVIHLKSIKNLL